MDVAYISDQVPQDYSYHTASKACFIKRFYEFDLLMSIARIIV